MDEKKTFFASLEPKSAMLVGVVGGILTLCTIGFVVMGVLYLKGNLSSPQDTQGATSTDTTAQTAQQTPTPTVVKADKVKAELFIMSYCPYGLQMQKAFLPVMELLGMKADLSVKWVSYAMHGKKEIDENNRQYCIQKEQSDKYLAYAKCFSAADDYQSCLTSAGVNVTKMNSCITATDKQFKIYDSYNDTSTWLSGQYPLYDVDKDLNTKYGVQGSPTLVINGAQVDVSRTPEAVKQAICAGFNTAPDECKKTLSSIALSAGFGAGTGTDTAGVDCGT